MGSNVLANGVQLLMNGALTFDVTCATVIRH
jgi:hypothetical protein